MNFEGHNSICMGPFSYPVPMADVQRGETSLFSETYMMLTLVAMAF